jgi:hypothetical protein
MDEPKTFTKLEFVGLYSVLVAALLCVELILASALARLTGIDLRTNWASDGVLLALFLGTTLTVGLFRLQGRSLAEGPIQRHTRTLALPEGSVSDEEVVEVRGPEGANLALALACFSCSLACLSILIVIPAEKMTGRPWGYVLMAFFGIVAVHLWLDRGNPKAWADCGGITAFPGINAFRRRFVPWSKVASCEIETFFDRSGKPVVLRPVLKDAHGAVLSSPDLTYTRIDDQKRLVGYIKAKLPKPQVDLWD